MTLKMLWKSDLGQGKHDPLEIIAVITKNDARISADLVVPVGQAVAVQDDSAGLLEVIDVQLAAIDELQEQVVTAKAEKVEGHEDLQEWADQFPDMIADLCSALGYAAHPIGPTGIPELDMLVSLSR